MKTDARVKYTKMVLKKALLELMQHKPVNKITVKEICERAELNRATFYAHYSDCFDLLESIEEELFGQFERSMQSYTRSFDIAGLVGGALPDRSGKRGGLPCLAVRASQHGADSPDDRICARSEHFRVAKDPEKCVRRRAGNALSLPVERTSERRVGRV